MSALQLMMARSRINHSATWSPSRLFEGGDNGGWWDTSDLTTLFQDAAGTVPAAVGDPVGLMRDKSGNGYDVSQSSSSARPTLQQDGSGNTYLQFNGSQFLQLQNNNSLDCGTNDLGIITSAQFDESSTFGSIISRSRAGNLRGRYALGRLDDSTKLEIIYAYYEGGIDTADADFSLTDPHVMSGVVDRTAGSSALRIDGTQNASITFDSDKSISTTTNLRVLLGAYNDSTDSGQLFYLTGRIYGAIIWLPAMMNVDSVTKAETWMAKRIA